MKALEILNQFRNTNVFATNFNLAMDEAIAELEALLEHKSCETCKYYCKNYYCSKHDIDCINIHYYCNGCNEYEPKDSHD